MLIRYPGSKQKLVEQVVSLFPDEMNKPLWADAIRMGYCEPFFGAGAIGFEVLDLLPPTAVRLNDCDYGVACLWNTVLQNKAELLEMVATFEPNVEHYNNFKAVILEGRDVRLDPAVVAFQKLALHQMSFSGLGAKSGGPLGGKTQTKSTYTVGCRWNPTSLSTSIERAHRLLRKHRTTISCKDFSECFRALKATRTFFYCDPPYYLKGEQLYHHAMTENDHIRLRNVLAASGTNWAVSYDDHPYIRQLYAGRKIVELRTCYTAAVRRGGRPKNHEIVISPNVAA